MSICLHVQIPAFLPSIEVWSTSGVGQKRGFQDCLPTWETGTEKQSDFPKATQQFLYCTAALRSCLIWNFDLYILSL